MIQPEIGTGPLVVVVKLEPCGLEVESGLSDVDFGSGSFAD